MKFESNVYITILFWKLFIFIEQYNLAQWFLIVSYFAFCLFACFQLPQMVLVFAIRWLLLVSFGLCNTFFSDGIIWCLNTLMYLSKALLCIFICKTTHISTDAHALLFNVEHIGKKIAIFEYLATCLQDRFHRIIIWFCLHGQKYTHEWKMVLNFLNVYSTLVLVAIFDTI